MIELQRKIKNIMVKSDDNKNRRNHNEILQHNESMLVNQNDGDDDKLSININLQSEPMVGKSAPFF
jgi:hypothetical protein